MKLIKRIIKTLFFIILISLILFIGAMGLFPKQTSQLVGYRFYTVLTNSMEPRIPTYSIICTKVVDNKEKLKLKKGDIITFKANRFNEDILITHHFNKLQKNADGKVYYRSNAQGKTNLDSYKTTRSDIIGTYVFHIPFIGKIILFLQSPFGFLLYGELFIIWLINKLIKARWKEKCERTSEADIYSDNEEEERLPLGEEESIEKPVIPICNLLYLSDVQFSQQGNACELLAILHNDGENEMQNIFVDVLLYDEHHQKKKRFIIRTMRDIILYPHKTQTFRFCFKSVEDYAYYSVCILQQNGNER